MITLRWEYIKNLEVDFTYIKKIIKKEFGYDVRELDIENFTKKDNLCTNYPDINEAKLLSIIEEYSYKKMAILIMRPLANGKIHPVYDELSNEAFKMIFKTKNRINHFEDDEYNGLLDSNYKVVNYKEVRDYVIIKLACNEVISKRLVDDSGIESDDPISYYESFKLIINIEKNKIFMFYNYLGNNSSTVDFTKKKNAFYKLFSKTSKGNIYHYDSTEILNEYFNEYYDEHKNKNIKKMISEIASESQIGPKKTSNFKATDFKYCDIDLESLKNAVNRGDAISTIESQIDDKIVKIKKGSYISSDTILNKEALESVCKEFYPDFEIYEL